MKKFNFFLILNLIFVMLTSCGTIKEGLSMQKKDNSDEFLVEKKSPLLMPPDFDELPVPNSDSSLNNNEKNEHTEWHNIVAWNKLADFCTEFLQKGQLIYLEGRLHTRNYKDKDNYLNSWEINIITMIPTN